MTRRFQFSLKWTFVVTAVVAALLGEAVAFPDWLANIVGLVMTSMLAPVFMTGIVYARGLGRAFCIGVVAWWLSARWFIDVFHTQVFDGGRIDYCLWWCLGFVGGLTAIAVRWLIPKMDE